MTPDPIDNPLLPAVLGLLRDHPAGLSEYQLIRALEADPGFPALARDAQLQLFQKHFLVMNALYRLRDSLWADERLWLEISPLAIRLGPSGTAPAADGDRGHPEPADTALRDYYLDWDQWLQTTAADVADLLAGFWQRYAGVESAPQRMRALEVLELPETADWPAIRRRYRELAQRHHPDRGGDVARFLAVRAAYETLRAR